MTDINPDASRAQAQAMRQARLGRVRMLRRRIVAGSLALFVAAWLLITVVLVTGHDPALSKSTAATVASSSGTSSGSTSSSSESTNSGSSGGSSTSGNQTGGSGSSGGSTSSVTTQQS
jgi:uncharacterized membrane protein YgcG